MRKIFACLFLVVLFAGQSLALKKVNGREIPEDIDFTGHGASFMNNISMIDTVLSELSALLYSTEGADGINVDSVTVAAKISGATNIAGDTVTSSYIADAAGVILPLRATKLTFGVPAVSSEVDSAFASAANTSEQTFRFKGDDYIPALGRVVDIVAICSDSVTHSDSATATTMDFDIGSSDGGTEFVATTCDETDDVLSFAADGLGHVTPSAAAATIYVGGTPGQNWEDLVRGKWTMYVIWYDISDL